MFSADRTSIIIENSIMTEYGCASSSGTPRSVCLIPLHEDIEGKFVIFLLKLPIDKLIDVDHWQISSTPSWAWDVNFLLIHKCFNVATDTSFMKNMTTGECSYFRKWNFFFTNFTFDLHIWIFDFLSEFLIFPYFLLLNKLYGTNLAFFFSLLSSILVF